MSEDDRVAVKTYVPRYQKEVWVAHADELNMTQSEFVRTMVQAGRSDMSPQGESQSPGQKPMGQTDRESGQGGSASDETDFKRRIQSILEHRGALSWDELVDALVGDVESQLDTALQELQSDNRIVYSGRNGGYVLTDDE